MVDVLSPLGGVDVVDLPSHNIVCLLLSRQHDEPQELLFSAAIHAEFGACVRIIPDPPPTFGVGGRTDWESAGKILVAHAQTEDRPIPLV